MPVAAKVHHAPPSALARNSRRRLVFTEGGPGTMPGPPLIFVRCPVGGATEVVAP